MSYNSYRPSQSSTPVVINLIIINALVYLCQRLFDGRTYWLTEKLALHTPGTFGFEPYQFITHMFAHSPASIFHILFNMYALWLFGAMLERNWGPIKFLIFYLACGLGAAVAQILFVPDGISLGASGAVMGLMAAFAYTYPNVEFFIIPIPFALKAKWLVAIYVAIDLFGGIRGSDGIAHFAHLGGLAMGFILMIFWIGKRRNRY